jgi:hypothetical protein
MSFIFSTAELIRSLWQLKTAVFLHRCLLCVVPLQKHLVIINSDVFWELVTLNVTKLVDKICVSF